MSRPLRWSYDKASEQHKGTCAEIQLLYCLWQDGALLSVGHFKGAEFKAQSDGGGGELVKDTWIYLVPKLQTSKTCHCIHVCTVRFAHFHMYMSVKTKATHTPRDLVMTSAGVTSSLDHIQCFYVMWLYVVFFFSFLMCSTKIKPTAWNNSSCVQS